MLYLIPRSLHVAALRVAHRVRLRWWKMSGARVTGCRVVVLDAQARVLLIRHSYGNSQWMLPGGGMKRGEGPLLCAAREVWEETAVRIAGAVEIGVTADTMHGSIHEVRVVAGWTGNAPRADGREITHAEFFALDALPPGVSQKLAQQLPDYVTAAEAARGRA